MMKVFKWITLHILLIITLFFMAFIPLYPKFPLFDIQHTWVYIRIEDFLVAAAVLFWFIQVLRKKATLKTPLTLPIFLFWGAGIISTIFAILFIFPTLINMFPHIALLHLFRRFEYLSVFFIAYASIRQKSDIKYIIAVMTVTMIAVCLYGYGQRGFIVGFEHRFPAFSTMNEEFAKGLPLLISASNRVQSTFAGHYDLAAYLVMLIPIMGSLVFGVKKWYGKMLFLSASIMGLVLLLMTASRTSFGVYLATITFMLVIQQQKKWIIPVLIFSFVILNFFQGISQRFASTFTSGDVIIKPNGEVVSFVPEGVTQEGGKIVITDDKPDNGEGSVNPGSEVIIGGDKEGDKQTGKVQIVKKRLRDGKETTEIVEGDFIIRKAVAYDISFTTRFQAEWPRAIEALKRNVLLGSGYSSITLATDNNYLRILGEVGLLGFSTFVGIFIIFSIYVYRVLAHVESPLTKRFVLGVMAGIFGLGLNAILIDVFEASKVAFVLWLTIGAVTGILAQYKETKIHYLADLRKIFTSIPAIWVYLLGIAFWVFYPMLSNYFVADDFTWLRWAAECPKILGADGIAQCQSKKDIIFGYFTNAEGFFYRPGMKLFFKQLYAFAWLNAPIYHVVSLLMHFGVSALVFLLSLKLLRSKLFAFVVGVLFLVHSSHSEAVFWISSVGHLFAAFFVLAAVYCHSMWRERKQHIFFAGTLVSLFAAPLFQEVGIVGPLLVLLYDFLVLGPLSITHMKKAWYNIPYIALTGLYLFMRSFAGSHWSGGDYSYNLSKLPFNAIGNLFGYVGLVLTDRSFFAYYDQLRLYGKQNPTIIAGIVLLLPILGFVVYKLLPKHIHSQDKRVLIASFLFFFIPLLPVLGLGNIALRYVYLSSFGLLLLGVFLLQKIYRSLEKVHTIAAFIVITAIVLALSLYHISVLQHINHEWKKAGEITNKLLLRINYTFPGQNATPPNPVFYFVDVPVKRGEAWVFPVGLSDAMWFSFEKDNLTVHRMNDLELALDAAEGSTSARVFQFDKQGDVDEVLRE